MFDTMTITKALGAVCGAFLIYLFGAWAAESLYTTATPAHGDEAVVQAYSIDTGAEAAPAEAAETGPDFAVVLASADVAAGAKTFGKCKACHKIDGTNGTGPHLDGVIGRARGGVSGYGYSEAMLSVTDPWTPETLNAFLIAPKVHVPGTKMSFAGMPKVEDRANVIAYLETLK